MSLSLNVLKIRDFRFLALGRMFTGMALQSQAIIVGWQVYSITHSAWMLGLTGLAEALPAITCALFSGHIVDTNRPHNVFMLCLGALMLNTFMLFLVGGGVVTNEGHHILPFIYTGIFISGIARSFIMPSGFSLLSQVVGRNQLAAASGWLNSGFQFAIITGPAMAGLIYGGYGARIAWLLPTTLVIIAFTLIANIGHGPRKWRNPIKAEPEPAWRSIIAGWKFILQNRIMLSVMALDMFSVLFGGATAMLPAYADQILHVGPTGLGILRAAPAIGSIMTALFLALSPMQKIRTRNLMLVITGWAICTISFGLSTVFWVSILFLVLSGMFDSVSVIIRSTLLQLLTPDDMRGRVSSVNAMFIISSNEIGAFESGAAASIFGLVPSVVIGGLACLGIVCATALFAPQMRRLVVNTSEKPD